MMPEYTLEPVFPRKPDGLSCSYFVPPLQQTENARILIVSIEVEHPDGSLGNAHGHYIASETMHGLHAFDPHCIVLDFRRLAYRWGNSLAGVFSDIRQFKDSEAAPGEPAFPMLVVTSDLCRSGVLSLVTPSGAAPPIWHFDDINEAIAHAVKASDEWLNA